jgi:hypothetical protein
MTEILGILLLLPIKAFAAAWFSIKLAYTALLIVIRAILFEIEHTEAILVVVWNTIGLKLVVFFSALFVYDKLEDLFRAKYKLPRQQYGLTAVDRGLAMCSVLLPLSAMCYFMAEIISEFPNLEYIRHNYLLGLFFLYKSTPYTGVIISSLIFRHLIRRRGPDTKWFGSVNKVYIKHHVRYCWCYNFVLHFLLIIYMTFFIKILVKSEGLGPYEQETIMLAYLMIFLFFITYCLACAAMGIYPYIPVLHETCIFHVGKLKKDPKVKNPDVFKTFRLWFLRKG